MQRRPLLRNALALAAAVALPARAQNTPPVRILVGAPPGGTTDMLAREIAPEMGRLLGRNVLVENRSGAGGNLAADTVAKAAPDGNTLLLSFTSHTINATLYPKLPFDPVADFTPLTMVATSPSVLVAHPSLPVKDVRELIAYARTRPGQLSFAIGGIGSSLHLAGEAFKLQAKLFIVNIPYRGTAPAIGDVVAGNVPLMFAAVGNARSLVASGKLKVLGVTSPKRLPQFPDAPAIAEVLPGYESSAWFGLFGPARMPAELTQRISDAARAAIRGDGLKKRLEADAATPVGNAPVEFAAFVKADVPRWAALVRYSGATPD
ncbi:MAG: tripartite tricarboxylate transporter substrate binding protein [Rubrivivax sp.]|jgi:tripartite-type tricarboxylate transporter receptor subunit TctC|nr:tripartite tricarboxylate transporter substrate binding protein [Rubrivivax sp.]